MEKYDILTCEVINSSGKCRTYHNPEFLYASAFVCAGVCVIQLKDPDLECDMLLICLVSCMLYSTDRS